MKKTIIITNLAMRFYRDYGWDLSILTQYLKKGGFRYFDDPLDPYWILQAHSVMDVEKLMKDGHVGELLGRDRWSDERNLTDLEILKSRNW